VNDRVMILLLVPPSLTVTVIVAVPDALATGVNASEPVAFGLAYVTVGFGTTLVFPEDAVTDKVCCSFAAPELIPDRPAVCKPAFSLIVTVTIGLTILSLHDAFTISVNDRVMILLLVPPSLTVTVIVAVPDALATGVNASEP